MMEILQDKPGLEGIYTVFYILYHCFNYIHIDFFKENKPILKKAAHEFINKLDKEEMKKMPKDFNCIISELFDKINNTLLKIKTSYKNGEEKKEKEDDFNEITLNLSLKEIKSGSFNQRLNGIKYLDNTIEKSKRNKNTIKKIIELLKRNNLIKELFGPNYHCPIINESKEIIKLLLLENQLNKEEIQIIWNCTKLGDSEAKDTILNLLTELADNLRADHIEMLLKDIKEITYGIEVSDKELNLVYKLAMNLVKNINNNGINNMNTNIQNNPKNENDKPVD